MRRQQKCWQTEQSIVEILTLLLNNFLTLSQATNSRLQQQPTAWAAGGRKGKIIKRQRERKSGVALRPNLSPSHILCAHLYVFYYNILYTPFKLCVAHHPCNYMHIHTYKIMYNFLQAANILTFKVFTYLCIALFLFYAFYLHTYVYSALHSCLYVCM